MRGTIEVDGDPDPVEGESVLPPLYTQLGLDIDAPHPAPVTPDGSPSAARGRDLNLTYPANLAAQDATMTQSPAEIWLALRRYPAFAHLDDAALWDAVAALRQDQSDEGVLAQGQALYAQNCAACHGETGAGDGVFATAGTDGVRRQATTAATDFTDPALLGASNALLLGKIQRGGMGTGMPAWGTIFSDDELQALLAYLWTFQFPREER
jgi:mono/diheme cytochrome c family protein